MTPRNVTVKRKLTDEQVKEIASDLEGTCKSIGEVLNPLGLEFDALAVEDCMALDEQVMLCEGCSWWVAPEEIGENNVCEQCEEDGIEA